MTWVPALVFKTGIGRGIVPYSARRPGGTVGVHTADKISLGGEFIPAMGEISFFSVEK